MKKLVALTCSLVLIGCTTISIVDQNGNVSINRSFGAITVEIAPGARTTLAEVTGLGYLAGPMGTTIGFSKSSLAFPRDNCQLIVWIESAVQVEQLKNTLGNPENLCIISSTTKGELK